MRRDPMATEGGGQTQSRLGGLSACEIVLFREFVRETRPGVRQNGNVTNLGDKRTTASAVDSREIGADRGTGATPEFKDENNSADGKADEP
jgi:hypothetical protein